MEIFEKLLTVLLGAALLFYLAMYMPFLFVLLFVAYTADSIKECINNKKDLEQRKKQQEEKNNG